MGLLPRKTRHQWIVFLLCVCLIGVFLAYKSLSDSEKNGIPKKDLKWSHQHLREKSSDGPKMPVHPEVLAESKFEKKLEVKPPVPVLNEDFPLHNIRNLENDVDYVTDEEMNARLKALLKDLSTSNWKAAKDADEMMIQVKSELSDLNLDSKLSCREIDNLKPGSSHGHGSFYGKKNIDPVRRGYEQDFTIKSVGVDTELKIECLKQDYNHERCSVMGNYKLMKELIYLLSLKSPSIIKLEGFCLRGETVDTRLVKKGALILTESSRPFQNDGFRSFDWIRKLQTAVKMVELIDYFEHSPFGSLGLEKLHIPDFVLVGADVKLVDLDNLIIGEPPCREDTDCRIQEMSSKTISCVSGHCVGRNSMSNLLWIYRIILNPLLSNGPMTSRQEVLDYMDKIQNLKVTTKEVLAQLKDWEKESDTWAIEEAQRQQEQRQEDRNHRIPVNGLRPDEYIDRHGVLRHKHPDQYLDFNGELKWKQVQPDQPAQQRHEEKVQEAGAFEPDQSEYERIPNANYPGTHDFMCTQSRVSWGCVLSVRSLGEAKSQCDLRENCASFVIFSSNPDVDAIMTMVMKNSAEGHPDANYGATLFKKKSKNRSDVKAVDVNNNVQQDQPAPVASKIRTETDMKVCMKKALNVTHNARASRERRLMTHLGLKGIDEEDWLTYAEFVKIKKFSGISQMASKSYPDGRFKFAFEDNALGLAKGEFMFENGPLYYHAGCLITYHLDRVLGLYHIPPVVVKRLRASDLEKVQGDSKWRDDVLPKLLEDTSELAVVTVPMPPVMKTEELAIEDRENLVTTVVPFSRNQRVHLEYLLLWTLTKQSQPQHGYLGYKGHLIHFEADLAFSNLKKSFVGYFYHCQFPNSVYKALVCYKCNDANKMARVCGLGEEVMSRMKKSGFKTSTMKINSLKQVEMAHIINNSAATILTVVDHCIKNFGREKVLY